MEGETDLGGEIAWSKERGLGKGGTQKKEYLKFFTWEEVQLIQGTEVRIMNLEIRKGESLVQFSRSVMSNSLRPHESQHTRPPCPSPTPRVHSDSTSIESVMPFGHLILCRPLLLLPPNPPSIRVFSSESTLRMRWPKYWSFSFYSVIKNKLLKNSTKPRWLC